MSRRSRGSSRRHGGTRRSSRRTGLSIATIVVALLVVVGGAALSRLGLTLPIPGLAGILPSGTPSAPPPGPGGPPPTSPPIANPGGGLPENGNRPAPPHTTYNGCPAEGDGGDPDLNIRKNRTDAATWYPVKIQRILDLKWPEAIERKAHAKWSAADAAQIAKYEGLPVQVEGWLAGAKGEGPESPNCHSTDDVDNHLWIVAAPDKDRAQSVVIEITPRVRAKHTGWALKRITPLVDGKTKVRISGWLLMDQEHPDQVGKTRGTIWEIHPIIGFDVQQGGQWVSLDDR